MEQVHTQPPVSIGLPASALGLNTLHPSIRPKPPAVSLGDDLPGQAKPASATPAPVSLGTDAELLAGAAIVDSSGVVESTLSEHGAQLAEQQRQPEQKRRSMADVNAELQMAGDEQRDAGDAPVLSASVSAMPPAQQSFGDSVLKTDEHQATQEAAVQQAGQQPDAGAQADPASPEQKKRRSPLPIVERAKVLEMIKVADPKLPDAQLAAQISMHLGKAVANSTVTSYRLQLGLRSVKMLTRAEMAARLVELENQLSKVKQASLPVS